MQLDGVTKATDGSKKIVLFLQDSIQLEVLDLKEFNDILKIYWIINNLYILIKNIMIKTVPVDFILSDPFIFSKLRHLVKSFKLQQPD